MGRMRTAYKILVQT